MAATNTGPERISVDDLGDYLSAMTRVVFQSGMGRTVVDAKWEGIVEAFGGFDPEEVADLSPDDVDRLCTDTRIIRNRRKIEATVHNAERLIEIDTETGFASWLDDHESAAAREKALRREFKYLGPAGIHEFLYVVGATDEMHCDIPESGGEPATAKRRGA